MEEVRAKLEAQGLQLIGGEEELLDLELNEIKRWQLKQEILKQRGVGISSQTLYREWIKDLWK